MPNFIGDEHFLEGLRNELSDLICYEKNNDLYKFHQVHYLILIVFDLPYSLMVCMDQAGAGRTSKFTWPKMSRPDRAKPKRLGVCVQQLVINLYTKVQIHVDRNGTLCQYCWKCMRASH